MQVTPSRIFLLGCFGFLAGAALTATGVPTFWLSWMLLGGGAIAISLGYPARAEFGSSRYATVAIGAVLIGVALGMFRTEGFLGELARESVSRFAGASALAQGTVVRYPDAQINGTRFLLDVRNIEGVAVSGRMLVFASRQDEVAYGDAVSVRGRVRLPEVFEGFDYPAYLAKDGVSALLDAEEIVVVGRGGNPFGRALNASRAALDRSALEVLPYREGAILKALLLGDEGSMTDDFKESLNRSGLRHIVAVSGMNITIIVGMLMALGLAAGMWRHHAFSFAAFAVTVFVALIGLPASAVRAAIMGVSLRAAPIFSRRGSGVRAAVAAAAVMVAVSPLTLTRDVGFQLSFLAVLGIMFFAPLFLRWFVRLPRWISEVLAMTCAAQLVVLPLLIATFGKVSLVAPVSNLIVVPLLPIVTVWGFVVAAAGAFWLPLGTLLAAPLLPYLSLVAFVAEHAAALPVASLTFSSALFATLTFFWYVGLAWIAWREARHTPRPIDLVEVSDSQ